MYILKYKSKKSVGNWQCDTKIIQVTETFYKFEEFLAKYRELVTNQGMFEESDPNYTCITTEKVKEVEVVDLDKFL